VSASEDKKARVWDLESATRLMVLKGHHSYVKGVGVTPDRRRAVSISYEGTLRVWDLETGNAKGTQQLGSKRSPDTEGQYRQVMINVAGLGSGVWREPQCERVSAGDDPTLRVLDLESCACVRVLEGIAVM
jgi:WD40 repeat protein